MQPLNCPQCGAAAQHIPPGATIYECHYCRRSFEVGGPPAPPPPPVSQPRTEAPRIVVVSPGISYASGWSMYWWMRFGVAILIFTVAGGGWLFRRMTGQHGGGLADIDDDDDNDWSGRVPLSCAGNARINVSGIKTNFNAGTAINASGNCEVICRDCDLKAPTALQATANGQITIINGTITGQTASIVVSGNGHVDIQGNVKVTGPVQQSGLGQVSGLPPPAASATAVSAHAPAPPHPVGAPHAPAGPSGAPSAHHH